MNSRPNRGAPGPASALIHRGPQALSTHPGVPAFHAPNAALLIDFDNVTMGIQKDLHAELRTLLSSDIIKGKVAVQRAYADWRRYPQYIVPLAESSIDMIMAPAYGSSKKNATDIRLAIDALELVFTRPEIGTFILLSGDSDFSSLVIKLKEYGKYVIGVGIRESSSDLLVMNCDEYYSYNALTGLTKTNEDEPSRKHDPWELVTDAITRMKRNGDVMRSDRLKQVMQEIDSSFDEKDLGFAKFSRFCQEAVQKGLLSINKLENGQLEVNTPAAAAAAAPAGAEAPPRPPRDGTEEHRRGRRGRGRGRGRDGRPGEARPADDAAALPAVEGAAADGEQQPAPAQQPGPQVRQPSRPPKGESPRAASPSRGDGIGISGERLTRDEAFSLVQRSVESLVAGEDLVRASALRQQARTILGRDSESLSDRNFSRILKDAHDANLIDLRRRGDDYEVGRAADAPSVAEQLTKVESAAVAAAAPPPAPPARLGMGPRGAGPGRGRGRPGAPPPELLTVGFIPSIQPVAAAPAAVPEDAPGKAPAKAPADKSPRKGGRKAASAAKAAPAARTAAGKGRALGKGAAKEPARRTAAAGRKRAAAGDDAVPAVGKGAKRAPAAKGGARPRKKAASPAEG
jgi:uncharacterized LabA/DUF88 family protein